MVQMDVLIFDVYNMSDTGGVSKTLNAHSSDADHVPVVCISLEGNGSRPSHRGGGYRTDGRSFTLNTVDRHSVCYEKQKEVLVFKERAGKPGGGQRDIDSE